MDEDFEEVQVPDTADVGDMALGNSHNWDHIAVAYQIDPAFGEALATIKAATLVRKFDGMGINLHCWMKQGKVNEVKVNK